MCIYIDRYNNTVRCLSKSRAKKETLWSTVYSLGDVVGDVAVPELVSPARGEEEGTVRPPGLTIVPVD